jgi:hypothetical protein
MIEWYYLIPAFIGGAGALLLALILTPEPEYYKNLRQQTHLDFDRGFKAGRALGCHPCEKCPPDAICMDDADFDELAEKRNERINAKAALYPEFV